MKRLVAIIFLLLSVYSSRAERIDPAALEEALENVAEDSETYYDAADLERFESAPIFLRIADISEIAQIPGITHLEARRIKDLLENEPDSDFEDIRSAVRLTEDELTILKYCSSLRLVDEKASLKRKEFSSRTRYKTKLAEEKGFYDGAYRGSRLDLYQRFIGYYDNFSASALTDKDAGEVYGADFYSGNVSAYFPRTKIIVGDFYAEAGQGSVFWRSFAARKGAETTSPIATLGSGIKENRSSREGKFFRGVAAQRGIVLNSKSELTLAAWGAKTPRSANIDDSLGVATSVKIDGYYRTDSEIGYKNALVESHAGGFANYTNGKFVAGATVGYLDYDKEIVSESKTTFRGKNGAISSAFAAWQADRYFLAAEATRDARGFGGLKASALAESGAFEFACHYRRFDPEFRSPFGVSFGESASAANETGLYSGLTYKASRNLRYSAYFDIYRSLSKTYEVPLPIRGVDFFQEAIYRFESGVKAKIRFKLEDKTEARVSEETNTNELYQKQRMQLRVELSRKIGKLRFRMRCEAARLEFDDDRPDEFGLAGFAEADWRAAEFLFFGGRIYLFDADSYDSAIWAYEYLSPGYMKTTALYGRGARITAFLEFEISGAVDLRFRYEGTAKNNVESVGSGYSEIRDNSLEAVSVQLDVKFD